MQTIVIYSIEMVGNKLLKSWENWLTVPSRILAELEAIFCKSLKYKGPDFSNHFKTSGRSLCLISPKTKTILGSIQTACRKFQYFTNLGVQNSLNIFYNILISEKENKHHAFYMTFTKQTLPGILSIY